MAGPSVPAGSSRPGASLLPDLVAEPDIAEGAGRARTKKSPGAFRTISEVADELHVPQHVLRFWETRFTQVRPLKRGGGRRYYRPDDITLLRRISSLLYVQGYTIKGVQRLLREGGGRLADDIPPASEAERAQAAAERRSAASPAEQPMMPGLLPEIRDDAEELRATLAGVLGELERLRALLR